MPLIVIILLMSYGLPHASMHISFVNPIWTWPSNIKEAFPLPYFLINESFCWH